MSAAHGVGLMVKVSRGQVGMQNNLVLTRQADMEYLGLGMVDPDDRVEVGWHVRCPS